MKNHGSNLQQGVQTDLVRVPGYPLIIFTVLIGFSFNSPYHFIGASGYPYRYSGDLAPACAAALMIAHPVQASTKDRSSCMSGFVLCSSGGS